MEAPFPEEEYLARYAKARTLMRRDGMDLMVVSGRDNFWYYSGLVSYQFDHLMRPQLCFLPEDGKPFVLVYGNERIKAEALPWIGAVRSYVDVPFPQEMIFTFLKDMGYGDARLGFELGEDQRLGIPANYLSRLTEALPKARIADASAALTEQRLVKGARELETMREACAISVRAYERAVGDLKPGVTRREVAERLFVAMIEEGANPRTPGFLMLNSSTAYDDRRYEVGDRMVADFGACYAGYFGDITRMAIFGAPTEEQKKDHRMAWELIQRCTDAMKPGVPIGEIPRVANRELEKHGYPRVESPKRIGHGIGMARAEPPSINEVEQWPHTPGMVLAIEPKVRTAKGSVHLEEDVLITNDGAEYLTSGAGELMIVR